VYARITGFVSRGRDCIHDCVLERWASTRACIIAPERLMRLAEELSSRCETLGIDVTRGVGSCDIAIAIGTDRDILHLLQSLENPPPTLTIAPPGYTGYLTHAYWEAIDDVLARVVKGKYSVREIARVHAVIDGKREVSALNEIAVFPQRSAITMEYTLKIDGEPLWRDVADGVIVSTPLGSTAYALSAGGPIILLNAEVLEVVPVNSTEPSRRPIVVPRTSTISIEDIASRYPIEAIADGVTRMRVDERIEFRSGVPVRFIEVEGGATYIAKRKLGTYKELQSLPPSAKFVYKMLELEGPMSVRDLAAKTLLPERTVRYALNILLDKGLVEKVVDPRDPRRHIYRIKGVP